jgi:hypothetical protein
MAQNLSEIIHGWLGWCPNAPALRTAPAVMMVPPEPVQSLQSGDGAGRSGRISRGVGFAVSGTRTLVKNKQLLWFSLLTGLVMAGMLLAFYLVSVLGTYPYDAIDLPRWLVLTFAIELGTIFCITVLLAGLILSLAPGVDRATPFREGLGRAKNYLRPLADWSVIMALISTVLFVLLYYSGYSQQYYVAFARFSLYPVVNQFPFNFILLPEIYHIGPIGGTFAILSAVTETITLLGINLLVMLVMLFVVPQLVLEKKSLPEAVTGSCALMRSVWAESLACFALIGVVLSAASLTSLLFRIVYGIVAPEMLLFWYPGDEWIAAAVVYMLALSGLFCIASTVAGIAAANLYTYGKTGQVMHPAEGKSAVAE